MRVLVACEESQEVCIAFRSRGHEAFSCDILECSGGHPEWHIKGDVIPLLNRKDNGNNGWHDIEFTTADGYKHFVERWDLIIAHPPCTFLTVTGNRWFNLERYGDKAIQRFREREKAVDFFMNFVNADCDRIAIENPIGCMSTFYRKPDCIVHPYFFGDPARKATCFWLKNLPVLQPTNIVEPIVIHYKNGRGTDSPWHFATMGLTPADRARVRSKTFPGIANAMAVQWSF